MTTGAGVELIGPWFGTGTDRGLALLFTLSGIIGLIVTLLSMRSRSYELLSNLYRMREAEETADAAVSPVPAAPSVAME
jgi:DHA3 family multidrug efflux protein-like MFS transporter